MIKNNILLWCRITRDEKRDSSKSIIQVWKKSRKERVKESRGKDQSTEESKEE